jgi:cytochrome P450
MINEPTSPTVSVCPVATPAQHDTIPPTQDGTLQPTPVARGRLPVIGHMWRLIHDPLSFFAALRKSPDDIVKLYIGSRPVYFITTAQLAHEVLVTESRSFGKGMVYDAVHPLSGNGLLASPRELHRKQRRILQPLFHKNMIKLYAATMTNVSESLVNSWRPGQRIAVPQVMIELTLTSIVRSMFSGELPPSVVQDIIRSLPIFTYGMVARTILPAWLCRFSGFDRRFLSAADRLRSAVDAVVQAEPVAGADTANLLSHLRAALDPETGEPMTDDLIRDELVSIMMAGTETTAATLTWAFHEISQNPDVERRLRDELRDVLDGRSVAYDDLATLPYTRAVVTEVLRKYSLLMLFRRAESPVVIGHTQLSPGTDVMFSQIDLHRDANVFHDPDRFDPDRWLADRETRPARDAFIPFGDGNRRCLGEGYAQAKAAIALATILSRWRLVPVSGRKVRLVTAAMPRPNSLHMTVTPIAN